MSRAISLVVLVLSFQAVAAERPLLTTEVPPSGTLRLGTMELQPCKFALAYCGTLVRPLDPTGRVPGNIPIAFAIYPHTDTSVAAGETIVAQEGGPGLPSIGTRSSYRALFKPMLAHHDLLMIDARGTGASGLIDCDPLQHQQVQTVAAVGKCGASLGEAADLYGTGLAVEDMVAVLDALDIGKFDYYGDSYGTFFGQVLAARHPDRLRAVVLDGAYPVIGESPWYPSEGEVVRFGFNAVCRRDAYCASLPGATLQRIDKLVEQVQSLPISGTAPDESGTPTLATADPSTVGLILYGGLSGPVNYRDLDAAIRALDQNDALPLLRLVAENVEGDGPGAAFPYSRGLYSAVSCMDYPQIYNMNQDFSERLAERDAALAEEALDDPGVYSPLTLTQFQTVSIDTSLLNYCLQWPVSHPPYPVGQPIPPQDRFTEAPTLVINGELDMLTPAADGAVAAAQFPHGQQLVIANSFHVDALGDVDDCTQPIVRRFVETLDTGDTSCAAHVKTVRMVPFFALRAAQAIPAVPSSGNTADGYALAIASAAVQTAGDVMARWYVNYTGTDSGLRGGHWSWVQPGNIATFTLKEVRWTTDLAVSGSLVWNQITGDVQTQLQFSTDDGTAGTLVAHWNDHESTVAARLDGTIEGQTVVASMPPP
jgi:pimeloyl-ACP methyl ester carboxylesterase